MINFTKLCFALTLCLFLSACGDDDGPESNTELVGTWTALSLDAEIESSSIFSGMTIVSNFDITGSAFSYDLVLEADGNWNTSGDYTIDISGSAAGNPIASNDTYTNVMGTGTYSTSGDELTINGSFFELEFNGQPLIATGQEQTSKFEINSNGQLVISQNETITSNQGGAMSTNMIISTSVWEKK